MQRQTLIHLLEVARGDTPADLVLSNARVLNVFTGEIYPVAIHYDIGQRIGLTGTPLIVTEGGGIISGYLAPRDLLERLRKLEQADASAAGSR